MYHVSLTSNTKIHLKSEFAGQTSFVALLRLEWQVNYSLINYMVLYFQGMDIGDVRLVVVYGAPWWYEPVTSGKDVLSLLVGWYFN